ncbi:MAG: glycosyltransferase family 25 protein [Pseudomonadota bacterium]
MDVTIYWINLDRDAERRAWMERQLGPLGLPHERVAALTPDTLPDRFRARFLPEAADRLLPGNIAAFSSHLMTLERFLATAAGAAIVLEDDVEIEATGDEIRAIADATLAARGLDVVKLNTWPKCPTARIAAPAGRDLVRYLRVPLGTGAYLVTRQGAERYLAAARGLAISHDNFVRAEGAGGLTIAGVTPPPIPQDRFGTSSLDPGKRRNRARNRRYRYAGGRRWPWAAAQALVRDVGLVTFLRLVALHVVMRARRVKHDTDRAYVISP